MGARGSADQHSSSSIPGGADSSSGANGYLEEKESLKTTCVDCLDSDVVRGIGWKRKGGGKAVTLFVFVLISDQAA